MLIPPWQGIQSSLGVVPQESKSVSPIVAPLLWTRLNAMDSNPGNLGPGVHLRNDPNNQAETGVNWTARRRFNRDSSGILVRDHRMPRGRGSGNPPGPGGDADRGASWASRGSSGNRGAKSGLRGCWQVRGRRDTGTRCLGSWSGVGTRDSRWSASVEILGEDGHKHTHTEQISEITIEVLGKQLARGYEK